MWAIASGIEGNLAAYEAVVADLRKSRQEVENFYLLGDIIGPKVESNQLVKRVQQPRKGEPTPLVCQGWWEEQILILHALGRTGEPTELIDRYGIDMTKTLWDAINSTTLKWVQSLEFGFAELDCFLIHGSSIEVLIGKLAIFKMPRRLGHTPKILVALIWILPGYFFIYMTRVGLLLTWLAVLPDWLAKVSISFFATPGFLILGSILVGLSSLLLWYRSF